MAIVATINTPFYSVLYATFLVTPLGSTRYKNAMNQLEQILIFAMPD